MPEFLDLIETFNAQDASLERLYGGEGRRVGRGRSQSPKYKRALAEATRLYTDVLSGRVRSWRLQEAMTTSDFSFLFADIIDRQMLGAYAEYPVQWQQVARRGTVRDFRTVRRYTLDGGEAVLSEVKQQEEYTAAALADAKYEYQVKKYGRRLPISWETLINDDLDALRDLPGRLGRGARRSEEKFWTALYAASGGPNSTFFSSGNKNLLTVADVQAVQGASSFTTTALCIEALQAAFAKLSKQVDTDGNPIYIEMVNLVVPPALEVIANNILNAIEIFAAGGGGNGNGNNQLRVANWMQNRVKPVVNPWLPIVDTTTGNSAWYLFASPGTGRPAMEVGFLQGHETPEMFQKAPNSIRVGGGAVSPEDGDFDTDSTDNKVRHVFGGTLMDSKMALAANGTNSP
jgi:hypothetical protein